MIGCQLKRAIEKGGNGSSENHKDRDVKFRDDIGVGVLNGLQDEQIVERYQTREEEEILKPIIGQSKSS